MPEIPNTPPQANTSNTLSGGVWVSGPGQTQSIGPELADYAEYRQWLTIDYTRNPYDTYPTVYPSEDIRNLTELSGHDTRRVTRSGLHFNITSHNSCTKLTGGYALSTFHQPQKFELHSQKYDKIGESYGEVGGVNNSYVFGPQGSIITSQPFINRRLWNTLIDVEYSYQETGTTHALTLSQTGTAQNGLPEFTYGVGDDISQDYQIYIPYTKDCSEAQQTPFPHAIKMAGWNYPIVHLDGYQTSSEGAFGNNTLGVQLLISFIEAQCATLIQTPSYLQRFLVPAPRISDGFPWIQEEDTIALNPYYDITRHDYT